VSILLDLVHEHALLECLKPITQHGTQMLSVGFAGNLEDKRLPKQAKTFTVFWK